MFIIPVISLFSSQDRPPLWKCETDQLPLKGFFTVIVGLSRSQNNMLFAFLGVPILTLTFVFYLVWRV